MTKEYAVVLCLPNGSKRILEIFQTLDEAVDFIGSENDLVTDCVIAEREKRGG